MGACQVGAFYTGRVRANDRYEHEDSAPEEPVSREEMLEVLSHMRRDRDGAGPQDRGHVNEIRERGHGDRQQPYDERGQMPRDNGWISRAPRHGEGAHNGESTEQGPPHRDRWQHGQLDGASLHFLTYVLFCTLTKQRVVKGRKQTSDTATRTTMVGVTTPRRPIRQLEVSIGTRPAFTKSQDLYPDHKSTPHVTGAQEFTPTACE